MSIKKYNTQTQQWEFITPTKVEHDTHVQKIASTTELGHVKVDGTTITIGADGTITAIGGGTGETVVDATTLAKGIVQLSNAIDSDSESLASTPKAVKEALAQAKTFTEVQIANLIGTAPDTLNTLQEIADAINTTDGALDGLIATVGAKATQTDLEATQGNVTALEGALNTHKNDSTHITQSEREAWNAGSNLYVGNEAPVNTNLLWVTVVE